MDGDVYLVRLRESVWHCGSCIHRGATVEAIDSCFPEDYPEPTYWVGDGERGQGGFPIAKSKTRPHWSERVKDGR